VSRIVYWSADETGCGFYRCSVPAAGLRRLGHTVDVSTVLDSAVPNHADVIVGQRVGEPLPSRVWRAMAAVPDRNYRMVYELDDDVFSLVHEKHNPAAAEWPARLANVVLNIQAADVITVTNAHLAEAVYYNAAPQGVIHVVPNAVPDELLSMAEHPRTGMPANSLGWSGSATHDGDWLEDGANREVMSWLSRTAHAPWPWRLATFGRPPSTLVKAHERRPAALWDAMDGTEDVYGYYTKLARSFDIGLAPLARTAFNRSKSDLRLLELAALGIPWLATDWGPYSTEGEAQGGWRVARHGGWRDGLTRLSRSPSARDELREQGRAWARRRTLTEILPFWLEAYGLPSGTVPNQE